MSCSKVMEGDIGTQIILDTEVDISSATSLLIKYIKPDGITAGQWTASLDATEKKLTFTTISGTLDEAGVWMLQGYIVTPTWSGHTERVRFDVHEYIAVG